MNNPEAIEFRAPWFLVDHNVDYLCPSFQVESVARRNVRQRVYGLQDSGGFFLDGSSNRGRWRAGGRAWGQRPILYLRGAEFAARVEMSGREGFIDSQVASTRTGRRLFAPVE